MQPYHFSVSASLYAISSILLFIGPVTATDVSDLCTNELGYAPFKPWFRGWHNVTSEPGGGPVLNRVCWWYADCCFSQIPDVRKQQMAATSLVMGLVPLILKDVTWPHRRVALIPETKSWHIEILVRALGLNPVVTKKHIVERKTFKTRLASRILLSLLILDLLVMYAALAVMELFSKRSSLGCPVPVFIMLWFMTALVPSALEVSAKRYRCRKRIHAAPSSAPLPVDEDEDTQVVDNTKNVKLSVSVSEAIPGGEEFWFVQFFWAIYYTAGTLIFSSIMLVTVIELFVWVVLSCLTVAASKMLGYKLCGYWGLGINSRPQLRPEPPRP